MTEYYIKKNPNGSYGVAKFTGGEKPESTYTVTKMRQPLGKLKCACPAGIFRGACKHIAMVAQFINKGEVMPFIIKE